MRENLFDDTGARINDADFLIPAGGEKAASVPVPRGRVNDIRMTKIKINENICK